jgi:hypothetical protein
MNLASVTGMLLPAIKGIAAWRAKSVAAIEAENIATSKKIALESIEKSLTDAGRYINGNAQGVFLCANNKIKKYKGYIWRYKE